MTSRHRTNAQKDSGSFTLSSSMLLVLVAIALSIGLTALLTAIIDGYGVNLPIRVRLLFAVLFLVTSLAVVGFRALEIRSKRKDSFLTPQPFTIEEQWIPDREVNKLKNRLRRSKSGESLPNVKVLCITRRHKFVMWRPVVICSLIGLSLVVWGLHLYSTGFGNQRFWPHCAYTVLLVYLTAALILAVADLHFVIRWRSEFLVVRKTSLEWWRNPPSWIPWMNDETEEIASVGDVLYLKVHKPLLGRIFGFGAFTADSASQSDGRFHGLHTLPNPEKIRTIVSDAKARVSDAKAQVSDATIRRSNDTVSKRPLVSKDRRRR